MNIDGARVAIQGFGNVGSVAAELFEWHGAKIVAVQDHTGTVYDGNGLDVDKLLAASGAGRRHLGLRGWRAAATEAVLGSGMRFPDSRGA